MSIFTKRLRITISLYMEDHLYSLGEDYFAVIEDIGLQIALNFALNLLYSIYFIFFCSCYTNPFRTPCPLRMITMNPQTRSAQATQPYAMLHKIICKHANTYMLNEQYTCLYYLVPKIKVH